MSVSVCSFCLAEEEANFVKVDRPDMIQFLCTEFERDLVSRSCSGPEERPQPFPFVISLCSKCHMKYEEIYKLHTLMVNVRRDIIKLLSEVRTMMSKVDLERAQLTTSTKSRPALIQTIGNVVEPEVEVLGPEAEAAHSNSGTDAEGEAEVVAPEMKLEDEPYSIKFVSIEPHPVDLPVNKNSTSVFIDESESLDIEIKDEEPRAFASGEFDWFDAVDDQNNEELIKGGTATIKDPLGPLEFQPASVSMIASSSIEAVSDTQSDNGVQIDSVSDIDLQEPASPAECQDIQASQVECQDTQASPIKYRIKWVNYLTNYNREAFLANDKIPTALKLFYLTLSSAQNEMINKLSLVPTPPCSKPQEPTSLDNGGSTLSALDADHEIPVFRKSRIIRTYGLQKPTFQNISMDEDLVPPLPLLPFPCRNCKERFASLYDLNIHANRNHCEGINCTEPDCKQVLASFSALEDHIRMRHFPGKHNVCLGCKKKYGTSREFSFHLKGNTTCSELAIRCNKCPRKCFPSKKALELHNKHLHIKPCLGRFACSFNGCGLKFDSRSQLKTHDIPAHSGQIYPCEKCLKPFKTHNHLKAHMKTVHLSKEPGAKKFTCNTCQLVFRNRRTLRSHEQLHREETPFLCSVCGKGYKVKTHLNVHMWSHDRIDMRNNPFTVTRTTPRNQNLPPRE